MLECLGVLRFRVEFVCLDEPPQGPKTLNLLGALRGMLEKAPVPHQSLPIERHPKGSTEGCRGGSCRADGGEGTDLEVVFREGNTASAHKNKRHRTICSH